MPMPQSVGISPTPQAHILLLSKSYRSKPRDCLVGERIDLVAYAVAEGEPGRYVPAVARVEAEQLRPREVTVLVELPDLARLARPAEQERSPGVVVRCPLAAKPGRVLTEAELARSRAVAARKLGLVVVEGPGSRGPCRSGCCACPSSSCRSARSGSAGRNGNKAGSCWTCPTLRSRRSSARGQPPSILRSDCRPGISSTLQPRFSSSRSCSTFVSTNV